MNYSKNLDLFMQSNMFHDDTNTQHRHHHRVITIGKSINDIKDHHHHHHIVYEMRMSCYNDNSGRFYRIIHLWYSEYMHYQMIDVRAMYMIRLTFFVFVLFCFCWLIYNIQILMIMIWPLTFKCKKKIG